MNFINLVNYIFSLTISPVKYWTSGYNEDDFKKSSFITLICFTIIFIFFIYLLHFLVTPTTLFLKILSIYSYTFIDIIYFILLFFSTKKLLNNFKIQTVSNKSIFILLYSSLIPFMIAIIILNLLIEVYFLSIIFLYGFVILFLGLRIYFKIEKRLITKIFLLISLSMFGYYVILYTITRFLLF